MATSKQNSSSTDDRVEFGKNKKQENINIFSNILTAESNQMFLQYYYTLKHNAELEKKQDPTIQSGENQKKFDYYQLFLKRELGKYFAEAGSELDQENNFEILQSLLNNERIEFEILKAPLSSARFFPSETIANRKPPRPQISAFAIGKVLAKKQETFTKNTKEVPPPKNDLTTQVVISGLNEAGKSEPVVAQKIRDLPIKEIVLNEDEKRMVEKIYEAKIPAVNFVSTLEHETKLDSKPAIVSIIALAKSRIIVRSSEQDITNRGLLDPELSIQEKQNSLTRGYLETNQEKEKIVLNIPVITDALQKDPESFFAQTKEPAELRFESLPDNFKIDTAKTGVILLEEQKVLIGQVSRSLSITIELKLETIQKTVLSPDREIKKVDTLFDPDPAKLIYARNIFEQLDQSIATVPDFEQLPASIKELITDNGQEKAYREAASLPVKQAILLNLRSEIPKKIIGAGLPNLIQDLFPGRADNLIPRKPVRKRLFGRKEKVSQKEDRLPDQLVTGQTRTLPQRQFIPTSVKISGAAEKTGQTETEVSSSFSLNATKSTLKGAGIAVGAGIAGLAAATLAAHIVENDPETVRTSMAALKAVGVIFALF